jgi:catechol-2,3-dioxygenase
MEKETDNIKLAFLDHVAIRVRDMQVSAAWYEKVLGLKKYELPKWGAYPIFMLAGKSGVALFPATMDEPPLKPISKAAQIDHFAFHVTNKNFEKAIKRYTALNLTFEIADHYYFESIYTQDPDGHTVELTTLKVDEQSFYQNK